MIRSALSFAALFLPGLAMAQCPTIDDMPTGINLTYDTGEIEKFSSGADGIVSIQGVERTNDGGSDWTITLQNGLFETSFLKRTIGKWHPSTNYRLDYDFDYSAAFPLQDGAVGGGIQTLVEEGNSEPATYSYSLHDRENLMIEECGYAALDIYQTYFFPDKELGLTHVIYLTDLGFGFVTNQAWPGDDPISSTFTSIATAD